jgi:preprotein translocase subunit SecG
MGVWGIVLGAILIVMSIAIIIAIILQEGNQQGVGVVTGGADSFFSKNKARSIDAKLAKWTKVIAGIFVICVIVLNALERFGVL